MEEINFLYIMWVCAMHPKDFGAVEFNRDDVDYRGSRFAEVAGAIFENPYARDENGQLPFAPPSIWDLLRGGPFGPVRFLQAARRTARSCADLRWGAERQGFTRIVHRFGLCLTGLWEITEPTDFGGYFRQGRRALVVARYSTGGPMRNPEPRAHGFALKLFPTEDSDHAELLKTANVFLMEDIGGTFTRHVTDAEFVNAPNVSLTNDWKGLPILGAAKLAFMLTDRMPVERQVYPIADLGEAPGVMTRCPKYLRIKACVDAKSDAADGRDELLDLVKNGGKLVFEIAVTDKVKTFKITDHIKRTFSDWRTIGRLTFDRAVASYNGDHVLHFAHPVWREDV